MPRIWNRKDKGCIVNLRTVSPHGPHYKIVKSLQYAFAALSAASQQAHPDTDKADDMYETIEVMEQDAPHSADPVDTLLEHAYQDGCEHGTIHLFSKS